ncbi:sulfite exporter TauE/SafE family protein [Sulfurospirillum diekertiae]|uniref:Probable membrane transporter protein n=1 Tax=Sulfurospirillum diekertiae TaxID=1854492 RepID=A0A6G9VUA3_9BACT|nr:sulfite exporter TauE/SafE family protein [Sulfurospirillum diekertiae]QIR76279.1 sulfite exporter TauE/SafE family protein [Sulfurospirillum diekertiae]QIR78910.1 sulfite exporter TauE/SafE family protein [Sulfurospirillum diekertiae]
MQSDFFIFEILIVLLAGFFHGIVGFGFPMIATPLFVLFLDLKQAVLYTLFPTLVTNVVSLKKANSFSDIWQRFWLLILSVMIGSIVGTYLLVAYYSHYYKLILAGVMLLYLNKERLHLSLTRAVAEQKNMTTIIMGVLSGLVGGMANIMSPVLIMLVLEFKLDKKRAIGVMSFCFIANKTLQILIFGYHGSFNMENSALIMLFVFISLIGFWIGNKIHERIDEKLYTAILNKILWVISFYLIYSTFYM